MADQDRYESAEDKMLAAQEAEAASRQAESVANILRSRAASDPAYEAQAAEAAEAQAEAARQAADVGAADALIDKSGMAPTLSDSAGNFAPNPEVASTGGIGVTNSNSTPSGEQATTAEEVDLSPVGTGITAGSAPVGDAPDATDAAEAQRKAAEAQVGTPNRGVNPSDAAAQASTEATRKAAEAPAKGKGKS